MLRPGSEAPGRRNDFARHPRRRPHGPSIATAAFATSKPAAAVAAAVTASAQPSATIVAAAVTAARRQALRHHHQPPSPPLPSNPQPAWAFAVRWLTRARLVVAMAGLCDWTSLADSLVLVRRTACTWRGRCLARRVCVQDHRIL